MEQKRVCVCVQVIAWFPLGAAFVGIFVTPRQTEKNMFGVAEKSFDTIYGVFCACKPLPVACFAGMGIGGDGLTNTCNQAFYVHWAFLSKARARTALIRSRPGVLALGWMPVANAFAAESRMNWDLAYEATSTGYTRGVQCDGLLRAV